MKKIIIIALFVSLLRIVFPHQVMAVTNGDLNTDGKVDIFDYNILVSSFGNPYTIFDYNALVTNFGTSQPTPTPGFSNLSSTLASDSAMFTFTYSGTPSNTFAVDMSIDPYMSTGTYLRFGLGSGSPITVTNPIKWDQYVCWKQFYWIVKSQDGVKSTIQPASVSVNCPPRPPTPTPFPTPIVIDLPITRKVMVLDFNPIIESQGNKRLREVVHWNDPETLESQYVSDMRTVSGGYLNYQIVTRLSNIDVYPTKSNGYVFTDDAYFAALANPDANARALINYLKVLNDYDVCGKVNRSEIDELWLWGGPWFGYLEANMAGTGAYATNGPPVTGSSCTKKLHIMGFSYQRSVREMIEDFGHRVEGTMGHLFGSWNAYTPIHDWDRFTQTDHYAPGKAACGGIHYAPNSNADYDWSNTRYVTSTCNDWIRFPNLTGAKENLNCTAWHCNGYDFIKWWLMHLPHADGQKNGKWNNWWRYVVNSD